MTEKQLIIEQEDLFSKQGKMTEARYAGITFHGIAEKLQEVELCLELLSLAKRLPNYQLDSETTVQDIYIHLNTMDFSTLPQGQEEKAKETKERIGSHLASVAADAALDTAGVMLGVGITAAKFTAKGVTSFYKKSKVALAGASEALKKAKEEQ